MPAPPKTPHLFVVEDRGYETPCHVWTRAVGSHGYGSIKVGGRVLLAHRHLYEVEEGPIPEGMELDHRCRVPLCVRPSHLEPVTGAENSRRGARAKLTWGDVAEIRVLSAGGARRVDLAARFGVSACQVTKIALGLSWAEAA